MSERFEVGEVAIIVSCAHTPWLVGKEVTIAGPRRQVTFINGARSLFGYPIEPMESDVGIVNFAEEDRIRKKKPPALDRECYRVTKWDQSIWVPKELEVTTS